MLDKLPTSLQRLTTLSDISGASKSVRDEDYLQLKRDYDNLVNAVSAVLVAINEGEFSTKTGIGSPEGVIGANYSQLYIDTATGDIYYNTDFGASTGWILIS